MRHPGARRIHAFMDALVGERNTRSLSAEVRGTDSGRARRLLRLLIAGDLLQAGRIIDAMPELADVRDENGWTPLFYAVAWGSPALAERLIVSARARVNHRDACGWSAAMEASRRGELECLAVLIRHGADTSAQSRSGWTALHEAVVQGDLSVVRLLLGSGADRTLTSKAGQTPVDLLESLPHPDPIVGGLRYLLLQWTPGGP